MVFLKELCSENDDDGCFVPRKLILFLKIEYFRKVSDKYSVYKCERSFSEILNVHVYENIKIMFINLLVLSTLSNTKKKK